MSDSILDFEELQKLRDYFNAKYLQAMVSRSHAVLKFGKKEVDHSEVKVQDVLLRQAKDLFIASQYLQRYKLAEHTLARFVTHVSIIPETLEVLRLRFKTPDAELNMEQGLTIMLWRDLSVSEHEVDVYGTSLDVDLNAISEGSQASDQDLSPDLTA